MTVASNSMDRRALSLQLTLAAFGGKTIRAEEVVQYASVLEDYLAHGKPSGLKVAGS